MSGYLTNTEKEKAILIGVITPDQDELKVNEYLDELAFLVETAGAETVKRLSSVSIPEIPVLSSVPVNSAK